MARKEDVPVVLYEKFVNTCIRPVQYCTRNQDGHAISPCQVRSRNSKIPLTEVTRMLSCEYLEFAVCKAAAAQSR